MFLSALTTNLNWEILTKNLVTFNFNIMSFTGKSDFFRREGVRELKRGSRWTVCRFKEGKAARQKIGGWCFCKGVFPQFWKIGCIP